MQMRSNASPQGRSLILWGLSSAASLCKAKTVARVLARAASIIEPDTSPSHAPPTNQLSLVWSFGAGGCTASLPWEDLAFRVPAAQKQTRPG